MWNTSRGIRTLKGPEARLFRNMVAFMLDQMREQLRDLGREEPVCAGVAVFDTLTLAQQIAALAEVVPALLDDKISAPPFQAVHDAAIYAVFMYYSILFEDLTPKHSRSDRRELLAVARQLDYEDLPPVTSKDGQVWEDLLDRLADAILYDRDFEMEAYTADLPPEKAKALHTFMGVTPSYHAHIPPDPVDPKPFLDRIGAYLKPPRRR